jgi:hypothetical protein
VKTTVTGSTQRDRGLASVERGESGQPSLDRGLDEKVCGVDPDLKPGVGVVVDDHRSNRWRDLHLRPGNGGEWPGDTHRPPKPLG